MSELPFTPPPPETTPPTEGRRSTTTIGVYADSRGLGKCRGPHCGAPIEWAQVVGSGRRMCFNRGPARTAISYEPGTRRRIDHLDLTANHWATCPDAAAFHAQRKDHR